MVALLVLHSFFVTALKFSVELIFLTARQPWLLFNYLQQKQIYFTGLRDRNAVKLDEDEDSCDLRLDNSFNTC